jgi:hypothetical protein|tara:strand:+ start:922 stop:1140 length:219 start_codon:yes stop_codon:yes gene_type:complete
MSKEKVCDWCYKPINEPSGKIHKGKPVCKPCSKLFEVHDVQDYGPPYSMANPTGEPKRKIEIEITYEGEQHE